MAKRYIILILFIFFGISVSHSQTTIVEDSTGNKTKIVPVAFGTKIFGGAYFFPERFMKYPGPGVGGSLSLFIGRFEIEAGALYYHKFDEVLPSDPNTASYRNIFHNQDYINAFLLTNIKIVQVKRNVFSGYLGFSLRRNIGWNTDTLMLDNSHRINSRPVSPASRTVGVSVLAGVRYYHFFTPGIAFVASLDLAKNVYDEYRLPGGTHDADISAYNRPPEPNFQLGFSVGLQFRLAGNNSGFYRE